MLRIGSVTLATNVLLAPIAGYCDLAFRLVVRSITGPSGGVGLACTDLLCPQALLSENHKSLWLAATCPEDQPVCMQLYGAQADILADAARWAEGHGATTIDINMGCPIDKVTKKNGGSMLLCSPDSTIALAKRVVEAVKIPVTAKLRLGWSDSEIVAPALAAALAGVGIAAITIHGRTTQQMFKPAVRLEGIARVVEAVKSRFPGVPVIGNGDIKSPADAKLMIDTTGCDGVMIARGALGQPWIFRDTAHYLHTGELLPPLPRAARARIVLQHFENLLRLRSAHSAHAPQTREGKPLDPERIALNTIKSRMSWYSAHLQPWPGLRGAVQELRGAEEFREFMLRGVERIEAGESPALTAA
ncbi:MAG: tRNA-dihydrouridine synthase [Tepidisphaeraceae bacterium]